MSLQAVDFYPTPETKTHSMALVSEDAEQRRLLGALLADAGYRVVEYPSGRAALAAGDDLPGVVCVDLKLRDSSGVDVLRQLRSRDPSATVIGLSDPEDSVSLALAFRAGAYDCVSWPVEKTSFLQAVVRAHERRGLVRDVQRLQTAVAVRDAEKTVVGKSQASRELSRQVQFAAHSDEPTLLTGEAGSGKEYAARIVHARSNRASGPFVAVHCATFPGGAQLAELRRAAGEATGGTLLVDEIEALAPDSQIWLEQQLVSDAGDYRLVAATRTDLEQNVLRGTFRSDLLTLLSKHRVRVPSLRERREDIPLLVSHFLRHQSTTGSRVTRVSPDALSLLACCSWSDNVRELESAVLCALLAAHSDEITVTDLPVAVRRAAHQVEAPVVSESVRKSDPDRVLPLRELERQAIEAALRATKGSVGKAAKLLGIGRATLYRRLAGLDAERSGGAEGAGA